MRVQTLKNASLSYYTLPTLAHNFTHNSPPKVHSRSRTSPKGCPKHHGNKGDPGVTPGTCGADGENAQVFLMWVKAPGVGKASHPLGLGVMRVRP